jgi:hypothetical protein
MKFVFRGVDAPGDADCERDTRGAGRGWKPQTATQKRRFHPGSLERLRCDTHAYLLQHLRGIGLILPQYEAH